MFYMNMCDNVRLAVRDICPGNCDTALFVHDWPVNMDVFEYQQDILPKKGFRCISYDLRGFGRSDTAASGYSYNRMAKDLYKLIRTLHPRNLTLIGYGMGGAICVRYMSRYQGYGVDKLALVSAAVPCFTRRKCYPYGMNSNALVDLMSLAYYDRPKMVEEYVPLVFGGNVSDAMMCWMRDICLSASGLGTINCTKSLIEEDLRRDMASINVPTAIFHGKLDSLCPPEFAAIQKDCIANAELNEFSDCGHAVMIEYIEGFNECLMSFMRA